MKITAKSSIAFSLVVVVLVAALIAAYFVTQSTTIPASDAKLNNAGYLPSYADVNGSKLFLISANATYGTHNGQACFIINATVRNEYTIQQPPPMDNWLGNSTGTAWFGLTATLYDRNGQVTASNIDPGVPLGVPEVGLDSGKTATFVINMATSSQSVSSFSIVLVDIAGYPIP